MSRQVSSSSVLAFIIRIELAVLNAGTTLGEGVGIGILSQLPEPQVLGPRYPLQNIPNSTAQRKVLTRRRKLFHTEPCSLSQKQRGVPISRSERCKTKWHL